MTNDETTRLRALLERAALPACEAGRDRGDNLCVYQTGRHQWTVVEVSESPDASDDAIEARAQLFAAIPTALPGLLDAAERAERADALLDSAGRRILNLTAERNAATERAGRAEAQHATVLASLEHALAQGDALNAEAKAAHDRAAAAEVRATVAERVRDDLRVIAERQVDDIEGATVRIRRIERERDDLAATLETRTAEHALAMARVAAVTRERDVALGQIGPLLDAHDALVAAARAAGWTGAGATGEELVAWVRRGEREACADAITARPVDAVREVREKTYRGTGAERDTAAAVRDAIEAVRDAIREGGE